MIYSLFTLSKPRSPLILNGQRGFLKVNRLYLIAIDIHFQDSPNMRNTWDMSDIKFKMPDVDWVSGGHFV